MIEFIRWAYIGVVVSAVSGLIYLLSQATHDHLLKRNDSPGIVLARKICFFSNAAYLLLTGCFVDYWLEDPVVGVMFILTLGFGFSMVFVNIISLRHRAPPPNGSRVSNLFHRVIVRIRNEH